MLRNANKEKGKRNTASLNGGQLSPVKGMRYNTERKIDSINQSINQGGKELLL